MRLLLTAIVVSLGAGIATAEDLPGLVKGVAVQPVLADSAAEAKAKAVVPMAQSEPSATTADVLRQMKRDFFDYPGDLPSESPKP